MYKDHYYKNMLFSVEENETYLLVDLIVPHKDLIEKVNFVF